jgi:acyl-CoA thioesterase-1
MQLPPNYGARYNALFSQVYADVAGAAQVPLLGFFLDGVGGVPALMQGDGIHPNAAAQPRLLDNLWPQLKPLL